MNRIVQRAIYACGFVASLMATNQSFAVEPGDFQATLRGVSIGIPLAAAPPPGLYGGLETFIGINNPGVGQNSAAAGANGGKGITVFGEAIIPALFWSTGWQFLGANVTFGVVQPFFTVAGFQTDCTVAGGLCVGTPPIA